MDIPIEPTAASLTIGDDYAKDNKIELKITLRGPPLFKQLLLKIPVGPNGVLRQSTDVNDISILPKPLTGPTPTESELTWVLGKDRNGIAPTTLTFTISNILCNANEGESQLTIIGQVQENDPNPAGGKLIIHKTKPKTAKNPILYFIAEPTYLIGGQVTLTWDMVGDQSATLDTQQGTKMVESPTTDTPSHSPPSGPSSWTYTLKVAEGKRRQATVNILMEGWHEIKPLGDAAFPSVIFDSGNRLGDAIYAIFMLLSEGPKTLLPVLYVSTNGITGWQPVDKENNWPPPTGMESSPGVRLGNRLWLIGGSAVDWDQKSKRICYYDLNQPNNGWKDAKVTFYGGDFEERMGHACVIVDDKTIWIMGGSGRYKSLNDVWSLTINDKTDPITIDARQLEAAGSGSGRWAPRCMFSAVKYGDEIWVCGGVDSPQGIPLSDIYYRTLQDTKWRLRPGVTNPVEHAIGTGVACCGSTPHEKLFVVITTTERTALMNQLGEVTTTENPWDPISEKPDRPTDFTDSNHSITAVGFQSRLYLRYLHRDMLTDEAYTPPPLFVYRSKW